MDGAPADGERWGCLSQDRPTRFVISWSAGPRVAALAEQVVSQTRQRTRAQAGVPWCSDGWAPYAEVIEAVYLDPAPGEDWRLTRLTPTPGVALTQTLKHRRGRRVVQIEVRATLGPLATQPYPVHIERLNGVLRDRLACLTRRTHAFAKRIATWDALVGLVLFEHNWLRPHHALRQALPPPHTASAPRYQRRTPAMALALTDHPWSFSEFLTRPAYPCS